MDWTLRNATLQNVDHLIQIGNGVNPVRLSIVVHDTDQFSQSVTDLLPMI